MSVLDSKFDILRGWPNAGAVAIEVKAPAATQTTKTKAGNWVILDETKTVAQVKDAACSSALEVLCCLIIEGAEDYSSSMSGTYTCLVGGNYVARFENKDADDEQFHADAALVPGAAVGVTNGIITHAPGAGTAIGYVVGANFSGTTGTIDVLVTNSGGKGSA